MYTNTQKYKHTFIQVFMYTCIEAAMINDSI